MSSALLGLCMYALDFLGHIGNENGKIENDVVLFIVSRIRCII